MHPVECTCNRCNGMDLTQFTPGNEVAVAQKDAQMAALNARVEGLTRAATAAQTVMMIVEPRSHKAEYLEALRGLRNALVSSGGES